MSLPAPAETILMSVPPPFEIVDGARERGMLLIADHAGRALPAGYGDLGLRQAEFERHIAYDIGVERVTRGLAARLGVPAVLGRYSRLLVDLNRGEDDPTLIRQLYDGTVIPGNYPMSAKERDRRLSLYYQPYHAALAAMIAQVADASGAAPFLCSVHSFTPVMGGVARPWHAGILWDSDERAARPLVEMLGAEQNLVVGENEPYDGALRGDTMYRHAIAPGFAHALLEIRQDLIASEDGADAWAERLAPMLDAINARPDMHEIRHFGSRTGPI